MTPSSLGLGVRIGEGADVGVAKSHRQVEGLAHVLDDPFFVVIVLDLGSQFDGGHGAAHPARQVGVDGGIIHHLQGVDFAQVQVTVDEGFGHQVAGSIDGFGRCAQFLTNLGDL